MKNTQEKKIENDSLAAIGIGAMIVFIALILVAAVAAADAILSMRNEIIPYHQLGGGGGGGDDFENRNFCL